MNTAFTQLSRSNINGQSGQKKVDKKDDFSKVRVNVVGDWSQKRGPSVSFSVRSTDPQKTKIKDTNSPLEKPRRLQSFNLYLTEDDNVQSVNEYNDILPDKVEGTYKYDFNIMDIHDIIMERFNRQKTVKVKELREYLRREERKMERRQNMVELKASLRNIKHIKAQLDNILTGKDFNAYVEKIKPLLGEYNIMGTLSKIVSFATNKKRLDDDEMEKLPEDPDIQHKRHQIIFDFLEVARKYIQIDVIREVQEGNICSSCGLKLDNIDTGDEDNGIIVCPNCKIERISVVRSRFYKDNTRTNNSGNNYEDRANFEKVVMRFQGKQPDKPPTNLYDILMGHFAVKELPKLDINGNGVHVYVSSDYIKNHIPLNAEGEKDGTSRSLMYKALKDTGNSNYYDHINIILHEIWGWELPDITHLEDIIMDDYDKSQRVYEILPKDRKSSLNSQFRLFKHLRRLDYPCRTKNFRIPTTHDILEFHENMWAKMCEILGWDIV